MLQECCKRPASRQLHRLRVGPAGPAGPASTRAKHCPRCLRFHFSSKPRRARLGKAPNPAPRANAVAIWLHQRASSVAFRLPRRAKLGKGPNPAPRWLGNTLAWVLGLVGPKGLEFAKYSIGEPLCCCVVWLVCNAQLRQCAAEAVRDQRPRVC